MTDVYEHPKPPVPHKARIVRAEVGCRATCTCGWSEPARNQPRATAAFLEHLAETKAAS